MIPPPAFLVQGVQELRGVVKERGRPATPKVSTSLSAQYNTTQESDGLKVKSGQEASSPKGCPVTKSTLILPLTNGGSIEKTRALV